jgi:hypothetical protein
MEVIFNKIDRKSKYIKKKEKAASSKLKKSKILIEDDTFDILEIL